MAGQARPYLRALELSVPDHREVDGHTRYRVACSAVRTAPAVARDDADGAADRDSFGDDGDGDGDGADCFVVHLSLIHISEPTRPY